ncbi:MAG: T9SS type A sorting domain-containing protein [Bacteroidia bacterium]
MNVFYKSLLTCLLTFIFASLHAQPANNTCATATAITVGGSCVYQNFTNLNATDSGDASPSCGFYSGADVWFSIVVPASGRLVIDQDNAGLSNTAMEVYTGSCGSLFSYDCDDNSSPNGNMPQILINDVSLGGQTILVQVWRTASISGGTFDICAFEPSIPTNVDCANATTIAVGGSCIYQTFTNEYAGTSGDGSPSCGFYSGSDVWFSMSVPASGQLVIDQDNLGLSNTAMAVYTGACGGLTEYECNTNASPNGNMPQILINDPTLANQTILVQVYREGSVNGGTFQICAFEPSIPVNLDCANATPITVGGSCVYQAFTNEYAGTSGDATPSCGFYSGSDVWFSMVVPASGQLVIDQDNLELSNTAMALYTGTCGGLTQYECNTNSSPNGNMPQILINDLSLANQTVLLQVYREGSVNGGTFDICAFEPSIPVNVDCANATSITVGATCTYQTFTNEYAGISGDASPSCGFYSGSDVWFSMSVPASGQLVIDQDNLGLSNTAMAVYTGACGTLTEYDCNTNSSPNGNMPQVLINDPTLANQTILVQVYREGSVNGGTFQICAFEPSIPVNLDCANATPISVGGNCTYQTFTNEYAGTSGDASASCGFYSGSDVWFSLTVPASGQLVIDQDNLGLSNTAMAVYTGACGTLTEYDCNTNSSPNGNMPQVLINDPALANQPLLIQVYREGSVNGGTFQICAFEPSIPVNLDCANALTLTLANDLAYGFYTNEYAGNSGDGAPSCGFFSGSDVWFMAEVSPSGKLTIDQDQGSLTNTAMAVYTGTCGTLFQYECNTNSSLNGNMPRIDINDVALASQTVYIQVWREGSVNGGTFGIVAYDPDNPVFPVEWLDFTAELSPEAQVSLNWFTGNEVNNDYFSIERSVDGKLYTEIGQVAAANTQTDTHAYDFVDASPLRGTNYYRIRQIDFDGESSYSKQVQINNYASAMSMSVFPNPAEDRLQVELFSPQSGNAELLLTDQQGRIILQENVLLQQDQEAKLVLQLSHLAAGMYQLRLRQEGSVKVYFQKIVIR